MKHTTWAGPSCRCPFAIALILLSLPALLRASPPLQTEDQHPVTGTVTDSNGEPLGGVNIIVSGKRQGTISDFDGAYTITAATRDTLVYSYVGYKTHREAVGQRNSITVTLTEDVASLKEVVVNAGYYTVKERERTGNISRITGEDIALQPVTNPLQALQGRMAGVTVVQPNSLPGVAPSIQIRGRNSLRPEGNYPMYIIDGVPVNATPVTSDGILATGGIDPLSTLNLNDIESIEVLKDADATAIYGSRGANGVILVTTKKGKSGKTALQLNLYSGIGTLSNTLDMLGTEGYLVLRHEAFANDDQEPTPATAPDLLLWPQDRYTDWQQELLGHPAFITDISASVSGGTERTSFTFGGGYHEEGMIFPGDFGYRKTTGHLSLNHTSADRKFHAVITTNYGMDKNRIFNDGTFLQKITRLPPNAPALYREDGSLNWENSTWVNPLSYLQKTIDIRGNDVGINATLRYDISTGISFKTSVGYNYLNREERGRNPAGSNDPSQEPVHTAKRRNTQRQSRIIEPQLTYTGRMGKSELDVLLGMTYQRNSANILLVSATGFADESLLDNLAAAEDQTVLLQEDTEYGYTAFFGRIGYNLDKKYFLNLTGRRDGSSRFGPNHRFSNFGAVGAAWIFTEEPWVRQAFPFLSFGKLRGSYGTTGSDQIGDYGYYDTYRPTAAGGLYPTRLANPDYSWEINRKTEGALELGFLNDRILFSASWYRNRSSNQLVGYALPAMTGFTSIQANLPATVENTGWELETTANPVQRKNFGWSTSLNMTFPRNKLVAFPDIGQTSYANTYRVGTSLNSALLYAYKGIDPETGLYAVEDVNGDNRYDFEDRVVVKDLGRTFFGGWNNTLHYKNFHTSFLFEFVKQQGRYLQAMFDAPGRLVQNQPAAVKDRWLPGTDNSAPAYQKATRSSAGNTSYTRASGSDLAIGDASFVRLKTVSLSYTLPQRSKAGPKEIKLFLHGQNLFTLTRYPGLDPQMASSGSTQYFPPLRTVTAGVQLTF